MILGILATLRLRGIFSWCFLDSNSWYYLYINNSKNNNNNKNASLL